MTAKQVKDFVPKQDSIFVTWLKNLVTKLNQNATKWGIQGSELDELTNKSDEFFDKYSIASNISTRTKATVLAKTEARKTVEKTVRIFIKAHVSFNSLITDPERSSMGLPIHKRTRTPAPIERYAPQFNVRIFDLARFKIDFHNVETPDSKAKPKGQIGAEIKWKVSNEPVTDPFELTQTELATHTPFILSLDYRDRGKIVYIALCWQNTHGERGAFSDIKSTIIP
ncbi:MAG: hypothetical protein LBS16_05075 [Prevotellaceae bacterium]|jgi:hypothetical protein|nr:hypothetical protein [Prevotellaceae bacterium]